MGVEYFLFMNLPVHTLRKLSLGARKTGCMDGEGEFMVGSEYGQELWD